jgi:thiol-disulfide isomerase/thioredoxin
MRKLLLALALTSLTVAACSTPGAERPLVGVPNENAQVAADFTIDLIGGGTFNLSKTLSDRPVVLNFWASWCPPCRQEMPDLDAVSRSVKGVQFVGVAIDDTKANAMAYAQSIGITYPIGVDVNYAISDAYGIHVLPQTWLIGQDGTVIRTIQGAVTDDSLRGYIEDDFGIKG